MTSRAATSTAVTGTATTGTVTSTVTASDGVPTGNPLITCEAHGGLAHGRLVGVRSDPADPHLPAATVQVRIHDHAGADGRTVPYVRTAISDLTRRWMYRPAPTGTAPVTTG